MIVHQNYPKILQQQFLNASKPLATSNGGMKPNDVRSDVMDRLVLASESMSDFSHVENKMRSNMNWGLLTSIAALSVKTGHHAGGPTGGE